MERPISLDDPLLLRARLVKRRQGTYLRGFPNVNGIAVGLRRTAGRLSPEVSIRVFVSRKLPAQALAPGQVLPRSIEGVRIDVAEKRISLTANRTFVNPLRGGVSVGTSYLGSGTLGMAVFDNQTGEDGILSNWHVLCGRRFCPPGGRIVQPGRSDSRSGGEVGFLIRYALTSRVDAALASIHGARFLLPDIVDAGIPRGIADARLGMRVKKSGRTTGLTHGVICDIDVDVEANAEVIGLGTLLFEDQICMEGDARIIDSGDSGSVLLTEDDHVVGLIFSAASDGLTGTANPIREVFEALDVSLHRGVRLHDYLELTSGLLL